LCSKVCFILIQGPLLNGCAVFIYYSFLDFIISSVVRFMTIRYEWNTKSTPTKAIYKYMKMMNIVNAPY
jgi:hypothetical protein